MKNYEIIISEKTLRKCASYVSAIKKGTVTCGKYLNAKLTDAIKAELNPSSLIDFLLKTKIPQIFAESEILGNGQDWNQIELEILGDIATYINVKIYDNGLHGSPLTYDTPYNGHLLYIAGALLRNDLGQTPIDQNAVFEGNEISYDKFYALYENRILPSLKYSSDLSIDMKKKALITIPGIGCGQFAGIHKLQVKKYLSKFIVDIFTKHANELPGINCVYFDSYDYGNIEEHQTKNATIYFRPLNKCKTKQGQLTRPDTFVNLNQSYKDNELFSIVAWDHVSWPGNDFWSDQRATDDGVKAAATDTMFKITGISGEYNYSANKFLPIGSNKAWKTIAKENQFEFSLDRKLLIY